MDGADPTIDELITWLDRDDAESRPHRAQRLRLLMTEYGPTERYLFFVGDISLQVFEEARLAYLNGLFIACVLLCQVCLEHMLAGLFRIAGRDDLERAGFATFLEAARNEGYISTEEFALFDHLREIRNPYTHSRPPGAPGSLRQRAILSNTHPAGLTVQDAEAAIRALLDLFRRAPFTVEE